MQKVWRSWCDRKKKNNSILLEACKFGDLELSKDLLDKNHGDLKADVNCKGEEGWTPFHFACMSGNMDLVKFLLKNQPDIDMETKHKFTALHIAAQHGFVDIVELLIELNVDTNSQDIYKNTALHYAALNGKIVSFLL